MTVDALLRKRWSAKSGTLSCDPNICVEDFGVVFPRRRIVEPLILAPEERIVNLSVVLDNE